MVCNHLKSTQSMIKKSYIPKRLKYWGLMTFHIHLRFSLSHDEFSQTSLYKGYNCFNFSNFPIYPPGFENCALRFRVSMRLCQGAKKEGRRNGQSALGRCVMRSRTGSSALHCSKVQNMAASESRWLVERSDCHAKPVRRFREILLEMK